MLATEITGATFTGTMPGKAMASPPVIPARHPQGGPDFPMHPYEVNPKALE